MDCALRMHPGADTQPATLTAAVLFVSMIIASMPAPAGDEADPDLHETGSTDDSTGNWPSPAATALDPNLTGLAREPNLAAEPGVITSGTSAPPSLAASNTTPVAALPECKQDEYLAKRDDTWICKEFPVPNLPSASDHRDGDRHVVNDACDAAPARLRYNAVLSMDFDKVQVHALGTAEGEHLDMIMEMDFADEYVSLRAASEDYKLVGHGNEVRVDDPDDGRYSFRWDGQPSFAEFMFEEDESDETDEFWRDRPVGEFDALCEERDGRSHYVLRYEAPGELEEWWFPRYASTDFPTLVRYVDEASTSDLELEFSPWFFRTNIVGADRTTGALVGTLAVQGWIGDDYREVLVVGEDTTPRVYEELTLDLINEDGELLEELQFASHSNGAFGNVSLTDRGQAGIMDEGDTIEVVLAPEVYSWNIWDTWAEEYYAVDDVDENGASGSASDLLPATEPTTDGESLGLHYEWSYQGTGYQYDLSVPASLHDYYAGMDRLKDPNGLPYYGLYAKSPHDDAVLATMAADLQEIGDSQGMNDYELLSFVLSFVQGMEYTSDDVTTGFDEYPRFPVETLVARGGDCEDTSVLFATLAQAMGFDVVMFGPPGHMAVGVAVQEPDAFVGTWVGDTFYAFAETTGTGWKIGEVPDNYQDTQWEVFDLLEEGGIQITDLWTQHHQQYGIVEVSGTIQNVGNSALGEAQLWLLLIGPDGESYYDEISCRDRTLGAGESLTCSGVLSVPSDLGTGSVRAYGIAGGSWLAEQESALYA